MPICNEKYIKANAKQFNGVVNTNFLDEEIPKEGVHYICIACINIASVMKIKKKIKKRNYPQVYLEESRYRVKKKKNA